MMYIKGCAEFLFCFDKRYAFFCTHSSVSQLLKYYRIAHADLCINTTWDCWLNDGDNDNKLYLDIDPLLTAYQRYCKIYTCSESEEYPLIWEKNVDAIRQDRPVILGTDYYFLPFHHKYQKEHGAHAITLYGFDDKKSVAYIFDYNTPYFAYKGTISYKVLKAARLSENAWNGAINSGGHIQSISIEMQLNNHRESVVKGGIQDILATVRRIINEYFHGDESGGRKRGREAVTALCRQIFVTRETSRSDRAMWLYEQLLPLNEKKKLFYFYLKDAVSLLPPAHNIKHILDLLWIVNDKWTTLSKVLLKIAYTQHNSDALVFDAQNLFQDVIRKELEFGNVLERFYKVIAG